MTDNYNHQTNNHFSNLRPDERDKLNHCRRNAIASGFAASGIAWLFTRYLLTKTPLQNTFLARNAGMTYTLIVGYALIQGIVMSSKTCIKSLATLENSRYGEFARRALAMQQDKEKLSRAEFLQKYPPDEQRKLSNISKIIDPSSEDNLPKTFDPSSGDYPPTPEISPEQPTGSNDMFRKPLEPEPPYRAKSFQDFQKENRAKHTYNPYREYNSPKLPENATNPAVKRPDRDDNLPPGPEDKSKVKRNKYGDVVYEE